MTLPAPSRKLPPLNALKAFEATARHLSVSMAAAELRVTAGAVSQQLRLLEEHAGGALFDRGGPIWRLTELGGRLQPILKDAFDQLSAAGELIYGAQERRSVSVSVPPSFAVRWLLPRMSRFSARHPDIEVWVSADMKLTDIDGGRTDVAVRYGSRDYPGLKSEILLEGGVMPVCSPDIVSAQRPLTSPDDLRRHTLIHVTATSHEEPRPDWAAWLAAKQVSGIDVGAGTRFDQAAFAIQDAANGRGVALAPRAFVTEDLEAGRLIAPFADGYLATDLAYRLVSRRGRLKPEAQAFADWVRAEAAHDARWTGEL
ncbi:MAG: LysR family transcriptional regulator [Brevundimonas sp.]|nr:MAG: LysR family transcriptional regulator [Brevundimonas sp.]